MPLKTIKQVRKDLRVWGSFWARAEQGQGYARQSVTARICEMLRTQVFSSPDLHLYSNQVDSLFVPLHIEEIGRVIDKLPHNFKLALKDKYIKNKVRNDYYLREAENLLISRL
ncbi:MAG: hypothetical protein CL600_08055 [Alteromonas sp.]|nr:hypothetical protein [Alteromonas sp.]